jgi:RNA polymerase sigma-70 factor, ECF subfamily
VSTSDAMGLVFYADKGKREIRNPHAEIAPEPDDETLLLRLQTADMEALGLLFHRYAQLLLRIARRVLKHNQEAEDLIQDVFLFVFHNGVKFDPAKSPARSWLMQVTYHRAFDRRRYLTTRSFYDREDRRDLFTGSQSSDRGDNPEDFFTWQSCLRPAFKELSEDQRRTLVLYFFEGYTLREISERLEQPFGNVQHHLYRGIDRLRKRVFHSNADPAGWTVKERAGK